MFRLALPPEVVGGLKQGVMVAAAVLVVVLAPRPGGLTGVERGAGSMHLGQPVARFADFAGETASDNARFIANWIADSANNQGMAFVIIDKMNTKVFVFDAQAKLIGATPVLIGAAIGDDSVTGIGKRAIADVLPNERTTPAGRFVAEPGLNTLGENVVWVDYDAAVSMHRVRSSDPKERRLERLATPTTEDNRISYGCVNVPVRFFEDVLSPLFERRYNLVYVLPEVKALEEVFPSAYEPTTRHARAVAPGSS